MIPQTDSPSRWADLVGDRRWISSWAFPLASLLTGPDSQLSFITWTGQPLVYKLCCCTRHSPVLVIRYFWRSVATRNSGKLFVSCTLFLTKNCKANFLCVFTWFSNPLKPPLKLSKFVRSFSKTPIALLGNCSECFSQIPMHIWTSWSLNPWTLSGFLKPFGPNWTSSQRDAKLDIVPIIAVWGDSIEKVLDVCLERRRKNA